MQKTIIPKNYKSKLSLYDTQTAIGFIKNSFQKHLSEALNLKRVSAPLFVLSKSGINDGLSGEEPVKFLVNNLNEEAEIVHSLAKWKRMALYNYDFHVGNGLYTDMNAIRKEEVLDNLHSIYVDQWDWEKVISKDERNIDYLKEVVRKIVNAIYLSSKDINNKYKNIDYIAPKDVYFIDSEELLKLYPNLLPSEREYEITKLKKVVFILKIGYPLSNQKPHDKRAPDYDDWNLNGDLLYYHETLDTHIELSSMGIRVDKDSLLRQLEFSKKLDDLKYEYHSLVTNNTLPFTIGGGIGQSRLCMLLLEKAHIGEVQSSIWDLETINKTKGKITLI